MRLVPRCPKCGNSGTVQWVEGASPSGGCPGTPCSGPCACAWGKLEVWLRSGTGVLGWVKGWVLEFRRRREKRRQEEWQKKMDQWFV